MNRNRWPIIFLSITILVALGLIAERWVPPVLTFVGAKSNLIQGLTDLIQLLLWTTAAIVSGLTLWRTKHQAPPPDSTPSIGPGISAVHSIPPPPGDFTGREAELNDLLKPMKSGGVNISGLTGMGGVGKTTLAVALADLIKDDYPDAQLLLEMRGVTDQPRTPADAMAEVIRVFHPTANLPEGEAALRPRYLSVLDDKHVLLLLDDAKNRAQVEPLIPPPSCALIVTSRHYFTLPGLHPLQLDTLPPADAQALLRELAPRLSEAEAAQLSQLCGYLPLALRLAGRALARPGGLTPAEYVQQFQDQRQRLNLVDASFALSYNLLDEPMRRQWRMLAVFPATFDRAAAAAVWGMDLNTELAEAAQALEMLVRASLLQWADGEGGGRYHLHDLARLFADARLDAATRATPNPLHRLVDRLRSRRQSESERATAQRRHASHFLTVLRAAQRLYLQGGEAVRQGLALFDMEWPNIQAGQAWAVTKVGQDNVATALCSKYPHAGSSILSLRQQLQQQVNWLEPALAAARLLNDRRAEGAHLLHLGNAYKNLGEVRQAMVYYEQRLAMAREIGDQRGEGLALSGLGLVHAALGEARQAIDQHEQYLATAREIGDRRGEGNALGNLGNAYRNLGKVRQAIDYYQQRLVIAREIGDRRGEGNVLGNLGIAYSYLGEVRQAIDYFQQRLVIAREIGDRRGEGSALGNLGNAYSYLGEVRQAIDHYQQHLEIARETGDRRSEGSALGNLGNAYSYLGEMQQAIDHYHRVLEIVRTIGDQRSEGITLGNLGNAYAELGEVQQAIDYYEQQLTITRKIGDPRGEGNALWNMSLALDELGERQQAMRSAEAALEIREQIEDPKAKKVRRKLASWRGEEPPS